MAEGVAEGAAAAEFEDDSESEAGAAAEMHDQSLTELVSPALVDAHRLRRRSSHRKSAPPSSGLQQALSQAKEHAQVTRERSLSWTLRQIQADSEAQSKAAEAEAKRKTLFHPVNEMEIEYDDVYLALDDENLFSDMKRVLAEPEAPSVHDDAASVHSDPTGAATRPPAWVPDHAVTACDICTRPFTALRRRHHCRQCGFCFCSRCCSKRLPLPHYGYEAPQRVCDRCALFLVHVEESQGRAPVLAKGIERRATQSPHEVGSVHKQGYLFRKALVGWKWQYFVLDDKRCCLHFFPSQRHWKESAPVGTVSLLACTVIERSLGDRDFCLQITTLHRQRHLLQASSERDAHEWIEAIRVVTRRHAEEILNE